MVVVVAETLIDAGHHRDGGVLNGSVSHHQDVNSIPTFRLAHAEVVDHQDHQAIHRREAHRRLDHRLPVDVVVLAVTLCLRIAETAGDRPGAVLLVPSAAVLHLVRPLHDETGRDAGPCRYVTHRDRLRAETVDTGETPLCLGRDREIWEGKTIDDESRHHLMIPETMEEEKRQELIAQRPATATATPAMIAV